MALQKLYGTRARLKWHVGHTTRESQKGSVTFSGLVTDDDNAPCFIAQGGIPLPGGTVHVRAQSAAPLSKTYDIRPFPGPPSSSTDDDRTESTVQVNHDRFVG